MIDPSTALPGIASLWASLGVRVIRWSGSLLDMPSTGQAKRLDLPRLRSALGKHARHLRCPESRWQRPCPACPDQPRCLWVKLFPGSALHEESQRLAPWVIKAGPGGVWTVHMGMEADELKTFWLALEGALSGLLGLDRGSWRSGPRWLAGELMDGLGDPILPLSWDATEAVSMASAPDPLRTGDRITFDVPLILKAGVQEVPPTMGHWLRLGRNRIARLAEQRGYPIWPREDRRWRALSESSEAASWTWTEARFGSVWPAIPKQHRLIEGWLGTVRIDALPEDWKPWASVMLWTGVGSKLQFGCGTASMAPRKVAETVPPPRPQAKISLIWKEGIA